MASRSRLIKLSELMWKYGINFSKIKTNSCCGTCYECVITNWLLFVSTMVDEHKFKNLVLYIMFHVKTCTYHAYDWIKKMKTKIELEEILYDVPSKNLIQQNVSSKDFISCDDAKQIELSMLSDEENYDSLQDFTETGMEHSALISTDGTTTLHNEDIHKVPYLQPLFAVYYNYDVHADLRDIYTTGKHVVGLASSGKITQSSEVFKSVMSATYFIKVDKNGSVKFIQTENPRRFFKKCYGSDDVPFKETTYFWACEIGNSQIIFGYVRSFWPLVKCDYTANKNIKNAYQNLYTDTLENSKDKGDIHEMNFTISKNSNKDDSHQMNSTILQDSSTMEDCNEDKQTLMFAPLSRGKHKVKTTAKRSAHKRYYVYVDRDDEIRNFMEIALEEVRNRLPKMCSRIPSIVWPSGHVLLPYKIRFIADSSYDNEYIERLHSFLLKKNEKQINWSDDKIVRPEPLANAGFSYEGNNDEVVCKTCGCKSRTDEWSDDDEEYAESVHRRLSPSCVFFSNHHST